MGEVEEAKIQVAAAPTRKCAAPFVGHRQAAEDDRVLRQIRRIRPAVRRLIMQANCPSAVLEHLLLQ